MKWYVKYILLKKKYDTLLSLIDKDLWEGCL